MASGMPTRRAASSLQPIRPAMRRLAVRMMAPVAAVALIAAGTTAAFADHEDALPVQEIIRSCNTTSDYCGFTVTGSRANIEGERMVASTAAYNCTSSPITDAYTAISTVSTTSTAGIEVSVSAGFETVFQASVKATLSYAWTETFTFQEAKTMTVQPGNKGQIFFTPSLREVTGDYEVHYGERRAGHYYWFARNVTFTGPDPTQKGRFWLAEQPMTADEKANCPGVQAQPRLLHLGGRVDPDNTQ